MNTNIKEEGIKICFESFDSTLHSNSIEHQHSEFEICYVKEGKCRCTIDNSPYDLIAGNIAFIPENRYHSITFLKSPCIVSIINFTSDMIPLELLAFTKSLKYIHKSCHLTDEIYHIFQDFEFEYKKDDILTQLALRNRLEAILIALIRHQYSKQNPLKKSLVEKVKSYVLENYSSQIYLSDIAKLFAVSEGHLSRLFKKETSLCLSEYINLIRLEQAQSILNDDPNMSVAEIARFCGFNDSNYFSYMFKKHYGVPPSHVKNGKANI